MADIFKIKFPNDSPAYDVVDAVARQMIVDLPSPMVFKGTLGFGGTITSLPTAESGNTGWTYKVITSGTYAGHSAKFGDTFISNGSKWIYIPSDREGGVCYGFYIDSTISSPSNNITYLEDAVGMTPAYMDFANDRFVWGSWGNAFFIPKPCMLKSNGTVDYYLDVNDYTKKEDGTASDIANTSYDGNAMMEWGQNGKKIWTMIVPSSDHGRASIYIADHKVFDGFHDWCFINHSGVEVDHFYTPIYNGSLINNKLRSLSGQEPINGKAASQGRTYAQANNPNGSDLWEIEIFSDIQLINFLLMLIGKSTDTQSVFGAGYMENGSELLIGNTGTLNSAGLFYGTSENSTDGVKVFGMENWWGKLMRGYLGHIGDYHSQKYKLCKTQIDGSTVDDYNFNGNGYINDGANFTTGNTYMTSAYFSEGGLFPKFVVASGSASTYFCDGLKSKHSSDSKKIAYRGGHCTNGLACGAFGLDMDRGGYEGDWHMNTALSCKPQQ